MSNTECECEPCEFCNGTGDWYVSITGEIEMQRGDDLSIRTPCDECGGTGVEYVCDNCACLETE